MGKPDDDDALPTTSPLDAHLTTAATARNTNACWIRVTKFVNFRCVLVLLLAFALLLSAVFWLPIFKFGDRKDLDLNYPGYDIVASFMVKEPPPYVKDRILELEGDIFDEMSFYSTKVEIISTEPLSTQPNTTKVVFAAETEDATSQSLIKASFMSLITHQSPLRLASSLFGIPFSFEVLKFKGGITASPDQKGFLFQNVQILFNFTLNFSIDEILDNFAELRQQLKTGLYLTPYENLYIRLTNLRGTSVDPPTTVQSQVLLAVGINPSKTRLKQLAQTISHSHTRNLGLNNTVFGRVKQVRLSSILQHSLGGDSNSPSPSPSPLHSPSPSPLPPPHRLPRHRHHHHTGLAPGSSPSSPTPAPAPGKHYPTAPPPCHFGNYHRFPWKHKQHSHRAPSAVPGPGPARAPLQPKHTKFLPPKPSPVPTTRPQAPSQVHARPREVMPVFSPAPSPSSAGTFSSIWTLPAFLLIVLLL